MAVAGQSHDISLQQDASAIEYGFMLARDKNGAVMYQSGDAPALASQIFSDAASYAHLPPQQELVIAQDEWHSNFGAQDYTGDKRYRTSYGADARQKGRVYNGPATTTLTLPTSMAPVILNPGFESSTLGSLPNNWTAAAGTVVASNTSVHSGTLSCYTAASCRASQALLDSSGVFNPIWQSSTITVSAWVVRTGGSTTRIGISDGAGTTWVAATVSGTATEQLTVTRTIAATAVSASVLLDETATNAYWDDLTIAGTSASTGNYAKYIDYNSSLYLARGTSLLKWAGTASAWSYVTGFANPITDLAVLGSQLMVATGTANFMFYSGTASDTVFTAATVANNKAQFLCEIGGTLWYNDTVAEIRNITTPNGTASSTTAIGLSTTNITGLVNHGGLLCIGKTDQSYLRASDGSIGGIMPETISESSSTSAKNTISYKSDLYIPTGTQSLWKWGSKYDATTISPGIYAVAESDFGGQVLALANDSEWLFALLDNSANIELLAGREETVDGEIDWRWHPIAETAYSTVNHAWVSTVGSKRLWICGASSDTPMCYYLPANYADPTTDSTYLRNTSGTFYTPWYSGGFIDINKSFFSLTLLSSGLTANLTITVSYWKLGDTSWTSLGAYNSDNSTKYFTADTTGKKIKFKLVFASNSATSSPILLGLILRGALMPTKLREFRFTIRVADDIQDRFGAGGKYPSVTLRTALSAMNAETWPVILRDVGNTSYNVKFQQMTTQVITDEQDRIREEWYNIVATECKLS